MIATALLAELRRQGVILSAVGDRLRFDAPPGVMSHDMRTALATRKMELLALLSGRDQPSVVTGIVWDHRGGVRLADPPDLRAVCLAMAERQRYRQVVAATAKESPTNRKEWECLTADAPLDEVVAMLSALEDCT